MKSLRIPVCTLLLLFGASCAKEAHFNYVRKDAPANSIRSKRIHLLGFFINKHLNWYGEVDRFYGTFYTLKPVVAYFTKECLSKLGVFFNPRRDFNRIAADQGLKFKKPEGFTSGENQLLVTKMWDYTRLIKRIAREDDYFMVVENQFEVIMKGKDNRSALLGVYVYILDNKGEIFYSKLYNHQHPFDKEDYQLLVSFSKYDRNKVQKRIMQIFLEDFIRTMPRILADLRILLKK